MVDYFALALSHGLLMLAVWHLLWRDDLDKDPAPPEAEPPAEPKPTKPGLRIRA
ncbi:hypothetical protein [Novosphingobium ginsenosidimutans]|uniref:hypothetical protein n=1 Tax=Novosphingobium ginsenosidimutans TaxID=1176536 RepID=UPI0018646B08|nr:hypothetical protein [Novosphingobium ginsenosidimutans]